MTSRVLAALFVAASAACGGDDDDAFSGPCGLPAGAYRYVLDLQSGSCTQHIEMVETFRAGESEDSTVPMGCSGSIDIDQNGCSQIIDIQCAQDGASISQRGVLRQTGLTSVSGTLEVSVSTGGQSCSGVYGVKGSAL